MLFYLGLIALHRYSESITSIRRIVLLYNIPAIALGCAVAHGQSHLADKYTGRLRHWCAERVFNVVREDDGARAEQLFSVEEACLASLLLFTAEVLQFDVHLQRAIALGARSLRQGEGLRNAVQGVSRGEAWAISISIRHPKGGERLIVRFTSYDGARPNAASEELLTAYGQPLTGTIIIPLRQMFETFAQHAMA